MLKLVSLFDNYTFKILILMQSALIFWDKFSFYIIALYIDLKLHLFFYSYIH